MPNNIETNVPISLIAGDTKTFSFSQTGVTAGGGWAMIYILQTTEGTVKITGTANGDSFDFTIPANKTENLKEQYTTYAVLATKADERKTLRRGSIQIHANPEKDDFGSRIRQLETDLGNIRAFKSKLAIDPKLQMSFGGRAFSRANISELLHLEANITQELQILKHGHSFGRKTIRVTLG